MRDYIIGSFNIQHFNLTKDFEKLAKIIKSEKIDILAIQEARAKFAVEHLVKELNPTYWDYAFPTGNEEYAFIWKKRRFKLLEMPDNKENPQIISGYHYKKDLGEVKLVRPPFVGYFTAQGIFGGCNFDIRLINTHIAFSKPSYAPDDVGAIDARRNELSVLSRDIYGSVSDRVLGSLRSIFTVLLGDYNLVLDGAGPKLLKEGYTYEIKNGKKMIFEQREKSTLKRPVDSQVDTSSSEAIIESMAQEKYVDGSEDYYSMNFDHFGYDDSLPTKYKIQCSRVEALSYMGESEILKEYREKISDHVPIKLKIRLI